MRWMHCKSSWRFLAFWDLGSYQTAICNAKNPQISLRSLKEIGGLAADLSCSKGLSRDWPCRRLRWQYVMMSPILDDCESSSSSSNLGSRAPDLWAQVLLVVFFLYWHRSLPSKRRTVLQNFVRRAERSRTKREGCWVIESSSCIMTNQYQVSSSWLWFTNLWSLWISTGMSDYI